jgi:hypothetical protein
MEIIDYTGLIIAEHQDKPNFVNTVSLDVSVQVRVQELLLSMIPIFDIDNAVGNQLDIIGEWAGVSRNIKIPITEIYFSWDLTDTVGWDYGSWQPSDLPASVTVLPDDAYKLLVKAKIAANQWDGTIESAYAIWSRLFSTISILIADNQNMTYDVILVGAIIDSLTLALLTGGYIPLKPEGVYVNTYYVPVNSGPIFGWDIENSFIQGWNEGSWSIAVPST